LRLRVRLYSYIKREHHLGIGAVVNKLSTSCHSEARLLCEESAFLGSATKLSAKSRFLRFSTLIAIGLIACAATLSAQSVHIYSTSPDGEQFLQPKPSTFFGNIATNVVPVEINVDDSIPYQQMRGFSVPPPCHSRGENSSDQGSVPIVSADDPKDILEREADELIFAPSMNGAHSVELRYELSADGTEEHDRHGPCRTVIAIDDRTFASKSDIDYKVLMQAGNFVSPGAYRIAADSASQRLETLAFRNPHGEVVLLALNTSSDAMPLNVDWSGRIFSYQQAAGTFVTFVWDPKAPLVALHPSEDRLTMGQGKSASIAISVLPEPLYAASPEVTLSCSGAPARSTCEIKPDRARFGAAESTLTTLTVVTGEKKAVATPAGQYVLTITAKPEYGAPTQMTLPLTIQLDK
jgi:hypothetical protein